MVKNISSWNTEQGFITCFLLSFLIFNRYRILSASIKCMRLTTRFFIAIKDKIFSCIRSWLLMKNDKVLLYDREINSNQLVHIHLLCFVCKNNLSLSGLITNGINSLTDLSLMVGFFFSEKNMFITKHTFFLIKFSTTIRIKKFFNK